MNKITVTLKQHTPLLHFQPMQEGATLRASEVKPKLDKFIIKTLAEETCYNRNALENFKKDSKHERWFVGDSDALNYQMRIEAKGKNKSIFLKQKKTGIKDHFTSEALYDTNNYPNNSNSLIMGNMGGRVKDELLDFVYFDTYSVIITTRIEELKDTIAENIKDFFNENCFGNRSSKGFGSFSVVNIAEIPFRPTKPMYDYLVKFNLESSQDKITRKLLYEDVFTVINVIWKFLKKNSGKSSKNDTSTLLASTLGNYDYDRIPSILRFKPHITFIDDMEYEIYIALLIDMNITPYTKEFATGVAEYIDKLINNDSFDSSTIESIKLNYTIKQGTVKID